MQIDAVLWNLLQQNARYLCYASSVCWWSVRRLKVCFVVLWTKMFAKYCCCLLILLLALLDYSEAQPVHAATNHHHIIKRQPTRTVYVYVPQRKEKTEEEANILTLKKKNCKKGHRLDRRKRCRLVFHWIWESEFCLSDRLRDETLTFL